MVKMKAYSQDLRDKVINLHKTYKYRIKAISYIILGIILVVLAIAEIPANNISNKEFANLGVNLAYKTDDTNLYLAEALMTDGRHLVGSGFEILAASCENASTAQYGYKAVAFINKDTKEIHIASASTKADINDILDDIRITFHYAPRFCEGNLKMQ